MQMSASSAVLESGRSQRLAAREAAEAAMASREVASHMAIQTEADAARQASLEAQLLHHR